MTFTPNFKNVSLVHSKYGVNHLGKILFSDYTRKNYEISMFVVKVIISIWQSMTKIKTVKLYC